MAAEGITTEELKQWSNGYDDGYANEKPAPKGTTRAYMEGHAAGKQDGPEDRIKIEHYEEMGAM